MMILVAEFARDLEDINREVFSGIRSSATEGPNFNRCFEKANFPIR